MMQIGAMGLVSVSQEIGNSKSGQVSEGFGSVLSALTQPENKKIDHIEKNQLERIFLLRRMNFNN